MRNAPIGYFCIILYDQCMIYKLRIYLICFVLFLVLGLGHLRSAFFLFAYYFVRYFFLEKNTYFSGFSWENQPQTHPISGWVCLSLGGEC